MGCHGLQVVDEEDELLKRTHGPEQGYSGKYKDATIGQVLKDALVIEARQKELDYFNTRDGWLKVPRGRAKQVTGHPPMSVKWVDVNKGDDQDPNYRSRLVAREIRKK
mgnify:CR=1 FL=1